jgi:fructoselysine 3-epimerase
MNLSFSTNAFVRFPLCEAVEIIAALGYEGVEILADVPHLYVEDTTAADINDLRRVLARTGLKPASLNANTATGFYGRTFWEPLFEPSIANPDAEARRWRIDYSKKCIDIAQQLGAHCISLTAGRLSSTISPEQSMDLLLDALQELVEYAGNRNIRIGLEYEPGLLIENCREMHWLLRQIDSPFLGVNLDLGHSYVQGENAAAVVALFGERIVHVHLEDIGGRKHFHLIPGLGQVDFADIFRLLEVSGYDGFVTVELYTYPHAPEEAARHALRYLNRVLSGDQPQTGELRDR